MKTKVCPCCDQPITGIYCKGCRKLVLNPVEQEIRYYLNTRHPQDDHHCMFHDSGDAGNLYRDADAFGVRQASHKMTTSETERKKAEIRTRMESRKTERKNEVRRPSISNQSLLGELKRCEALPASDQQRKAIMSGLIVGLVFFMMVFSSVIFEIISMWI